MTSYVNIFEDMEFTLRLLSGEFDDKIKKGKMKIEPVYSKKQIDLGDTVLTEATTMDELVDIEPKAEPVIDEDYDEEEQISAPKCTDIELAVSVVSGSCTDMTKEDFEPEVYAEAEELYYSMSDIDYTEEKELGVGTVITQSNKRLGDFLIARTKSIESWEDYTPRFTEYTYEDDELNVVEECDATMFSYAKAFHCMGLPDVA